MSNARKEVSSGIRARGDSLSFSFFFSSSFSLLMQYSQLFEFVVTQIGGNDGILNALQQSEIKLFLQKLDLDMCKENIYSQSFYIFLFLFLFFYVFLQIFMFNGKRALFDIVTSFWFAFQRSKIDTAIGVLINVGVPCV